jgi:hypothetical protein
MPLDMDRTVVAMDASVFILCATIFSCGSVMVASGQDTVSGDRNQLFATSFQNLVKKAILLTHDFDIEMQKWKKGEHNNETMVSITDSYVPKFQELITSSNSLQTPKQFENVTKLYVKSLQAELQSNIHYRNSLVSGNTTESLLSSKLYSDALRYEMESFAAFKSGAAKLSTG